MAEAPDAPPAPRRKLNIFSSYLHFTYKGCRKISAIEEVVRNGVGPTNWARCYARSGVHEVSCFCRARALALA